MNRQTINDWIDKQLALVANNLPDLVETNPSGFECGRNVGIKQTLLDLQKIIEDGAQLYKSYCWCNDKYHPPGAICL